MESEIYIRSKMDIKSKSIFSLIFVPATGRRTLPEKVAAEDEAEHEDEEADAQDDDIDVEGEVVDVRRHAAVVFRAMKTQTTKASCQEERSNAQVCHSVRL